MKGLQELITTYGISLATEFKPGVGIVPTGKLRIARGDKAKKNGDFDSIVSAKSKIIDLLTAEENAKKEAMELRQAKIDAIPGLTEICSAISDLEAWRREFDASFSDCGGLGVRAKPVYDFDKLYEMYPRAKAYLKAELFSNSSHYAKSAAGKKALESIIDGADPEKTIEQMEKEWGEYCDEHIWD